MSDETLNGLSIHEAWALRRRMIYALTLFTAVYIIYVSYYVATPTNIHETIVTGLIDLTQLVIICWIFGSVVDDRWGNMASMIKKN